MATMIEETPPNALQRIQYNDGLFLTAQLCISEQQFFRDMLIYILSSLFGSSGVFYGLQLTANNNATFVSISPGIAVDTSGRLLAWPSSITNFPIPVNALITGQTTDIYIAFQTLTSGQTSGTTTNPAGSNLLYDLPTLTFGPVGSGDSNLLLGTAKGNKDGTTAKITPNPTLVAPQIRTTLFPSSPTTNTASNTTTNTTTS